MKKLFLLTAILFGFIVHANACTKLVIAMGWPQAGAIINAGYQVGAYYGNGNESYNIFYTTESQGWVYPNYVIQVQNDTMDSYVESGEWQRNIFGCLDNDVGINNYNFGCGNDEGTQYTSWIISQENIYPGKC